MDIGRELIQRGWRQGSLLSAASARMSWLALGDTRAWESREVPLNASEFLAVISNDCDIARSSDHEPRVEAIRAYWTSDRRVIREARLNSVRRFLLRRRTAADGNEEGLIADATNRVQIEKHALLALSPEWSFQDGDTETPRRFRSWLAARYDRPALDDAIVHAVVRPITRAIDRLGDRDDIYHILGGIREIRLLVTEGAPYEVELFLMREETPRAPPVSAEDAASLAGWIADVLGRHGEAQLSAWDIYTAATISYQDILASWPLPLDQYSLAEPAAAVETAEAMAVETTESMPGEVFEGQ